MDRAQHSSHGSLDDFVFESRHAPGELHRDSANLWDRLKSSIRFTLCADSGLSF